MANELDKTIEELEAEVIAELEEGAHDAPKKGAVPSEPMKKKKDDGAKLGVSSRGMGSLNQKNGANYVRDDFYLATAADIVADPSAPNAFVQGIMEGKEWVWNHGTLVEAELVRMKDRIERRTRSRHAKEDALEFAKFLKLL